MFLLRRVTNQISHGFRSLFTPFRRIQTSLQRMRSNNIFTQGRNRLRMMQGRMRYFTQLPRRYLGIKIDDPKLPSNMAIRGDSDEEGGSGIPRIAELGSSAVDYRQRRDKPQRARNLQYPHILSSQLHLVHNVTNERRILHIGIHGSGARVQTQLNGVMLYFEQDDNAESAQPVVLVSSNHPNVLLNEQPLQGKMPVLHQSYLDVNGTLYVCELLDPERVSPRSHVNAAWSTTIGQVRRENQDAIGVYQSPGTYLFSVADGVGGGYAGDRMSRYATQYLLKAFQVNWQRNIAWEQLLEQAVIHINAEVRRFLHNLPHDAGTTLTAVVIDEWKAHIAHVGDSKLYLLRNHRLEPITQDHVDQQLASAGTNNGSQNGIARSILTRAIGKNDVIAPDMHELYLQPGDRLLLCTDGITSCVSHEEIVEWMSSETLSSIPETLVQLSNERKSTDNASAVVIEVVNKLRGKDKWSARSSTRVYAGSNGQTPPLQPLQESDEERAERVERNRSLTGIAAILVLSLFIVVLLIWGVNYYQTTLRPQLEMGAAQTEVTEEASLERTEEAATAPTLVQFPPPGSTPEFTRTLPPVVTNTPGAERASATPTQTATTVPTQGATSTTRPSNRNR